LQTQRSVDVEAAKKRDTSSGVYDGGGQHVFETLKSVDVEAVKERDTSSSVYDGGGQRVFEIQTEVNRDAAKKYYVIHVDKLKLYSAATLSHDSVATQPTTH